MGYLPDHTCMHPAGRASMSQHCTPSPPRPVPLASAGSAVPAEYNLDALNGISFTKGCYVGQASFRAGVPAEGPHLHVCVCARSLASGRAVREPPANVYTRSQGRAD